MNRYEFQDEKKKHIHMLDAKPLMGTTTIINEVYPPALHWWAAGLALEPFGWTNPKKTTPEAAIEAAIKGQAGLKSLVDLPIDAYMKVLDACYRAHDAFKRKKGTEGTDIHGLIENYIRYCIEKNEGKPLNNPDVIWEGIEKFVSWASQDVDTFLYCEAHCYSEKLWTGGRFDFIFKHKNGKVLVGDNKPSVYPKNFIQAGGYSLQIKENGIYDNKGNLLGKVDVIDGFCIYNYNDGESRYLSGDWVPRLESDFVHTVDMYQRKDLVGDKVLT